MRLFILHVNIHLLRFHVSQVHYCPIRFSELWSQRIMIHENHWIQRCSIQLKPLSRRASHVYKDSRNACSHPQHSASEC
jgi:hypothetical protein